jgi:hypothetical protein
MSWVKRAAGAESLPNILASHSLNADAIAVAVSAANDCHY